MKLARFIKNHQEEITDEWVKNAQDNIDITKKMSLKDVRDHIQQMLEAIVDNMDTPESDAHQEKKSKGNKDSKQNKKAGDQHGVQRANMGFDILEVSSEFRALRASVLRLWENKSKKENWENDFQDLTRFNEAIDELWMISLERYEKRVSESKNWFMGVLGHDLRNPLAAIMGMQSIFKLSKNLSDKENDILMHSVSSAKRMKELIDNLLELTNVRLGGGLSINKDTLDLTTQSENLLKEMQLGYPDALLLIETNGPVEGEWDPTRLDQLMTNLITNAIKYGEPGGPVKVKISAKGNEAYLDVHNEGTPIPESIKEKFFTGNVSENRKNSTNENSYGLGLYIVKEIVDGHKGKIKLTSTKEKGTNFRVVLPRKISSS